MIFSDMCICVVQILMVGMGTVADCMVSVQLWQQMVDWRPVLS